MAWEWSHTQEAYRAAEVNMRNLPRPVLEEIFAEWHANLKGYPVAVTNFSHAKAQKARAQARRMSEEDLQRSIWNMARGQRLCTRGGWRAWMCPYGCESHMVGLSVDRVDNSEEE